MGRKPKYAEARETKKDHEPSFEFKLPESRELSLLAGAALFTGVVVVGIGIGAAIGTQVFIGSVALLGLVVMSERYPTIKFVIQRSNMLVDLVIFAGSIYAVSALGVTVAGGLTVMGLGYTLLYAPYVRRQRNSKNK